MPRRARGRTPRILPGMVAAVLAVMLAVGWLAAPAAAAPRQALDLNRASLEEIMALPIPQDLAQKIHDHRTYVRYFDNVFDLMEIDGMTTEIFARLKPLVSTMPPDVRDAGIARLSASYRQVQQYLGQEGSSEGLSDEYLDKMRNPENLNEMDLFDLMSYQNVSPVDATNILKARERLGRFESSRQLRNSEGLRYYSFRNLRDFVVYSEEEKNIDSRWPVTGYVQTRFWQTPFSGDDDELGSFASGAPRGRYTVDQKALYQPGWLNKVRWSAKGGYVGGLLVDREYGEKNFDETAKGFVGITDRKFGDVRLKGFYVGDFRVAYGLGLIMDNTDYIHFRKTGYGFNKRLLGIHGDLSRSYEYNLRGAAVEGSYGRVNGSFFVSSDRKDGILNPDGESINRYVVMRPRPEAEWLEERTVGGVPSYLRRDAFQEDILGGNMKVMLAPGTFVGVTGYEARYDKPWRADEATLVADTDLLETRDNEIWNAYTSYYLDDNGEVQKADWRRIMGAEAQAVVGNMAVQGEYAFLQQPGNDFLTSDNPDAYIVNTFAQWENLHLLGIWRDYDVGFDNPYGRAFSNDSRYEMTLLDSPYRLNDDLYTWTETGTPQPKAERGLYLETRYRISRALTLSGLSFDKWERKADGADMMRYTLKAEYQPKFNIRFRVRHRYSSRSEADPNDVRTYRNWETRWQMITMLSNYNRLQFMYMTSNVMFPPRTRWPFAGTPDAGAGDSAVGTAGMPAQAFEVRYEHNLTPGIELTFASSIYDGFLWNFEGNEFVLLDGTGFRNWFKIQSRVSERMLFQLKVTRDHNLPKTYVDVRDFGDPLGNEPDAEYAPKDDTIVRLQMDYTF